jgi:methylated-DNA-[protein]-cysteine S-methyltransferase
MVKNAVSPFAKKVYKVVLSIPLGETRTYKWVAEKAGRPGAARAVGQALNRNPYPLIIPCHRVVGCSKKNGGYMFGMKKKELLLDREKKIRQWLETRE